MDWLEVKLGVIILERSYTVSFLRARFIPKDRYQLNIRDIS